MNHAMHYYRLIFNSKDRLKLPDMEGHHSVPKHWFLNGRKKRDYDHSIVFLTRREHFVAHRLLAKIYPECEKAQLALLRMINTEPKRIKYCSNSRVYENAKGHFIDLVRKLRSDPIADANRRRATSDYMKKAWSERYGQMMSRIIATRSSPRDAYRRQKSSEALIAKNAQGLREDTIRRNSGMKHMTKEQIESMSHGLKIYRESDRFKTNLSNLKAMNRERISVLDNSGVNHFITREEYELEKGKKFHHVNTKQAKSIRSKLRIATSAK